MFEVETEVETDSKEGSCQYDPIENAKGILIAYLACSFAPGGLSRTEFLNLCNSMAHRPSDTCQVSTLKRQLVLIH